ncbi:hypothetical protein B1C81_37100 [Streptomyces sp. HG99]|nr:MULTISPECIES: hypothetical protein [Streptomyces]PIB03466.1 hypothetical protein B1C81_37100 [Streptomyces sp. HG99]
MSVIGRETDTALDMTRDRFGRTVHAGAAAAALTRRNQAAVEAYRTHLAPYADGLLNAARRALDELPPARHLTGWQTVLDALGTSAAEIRRALDRPAAPGSAAERAQHAVDRPAAPGSAAERAQHAALWPHLASWADHSFIASSLVGQHHQPETPLTGEEQQRWTEKAQAAQRRGELELTESWYAADGQPITLAHLIEDDDSTLIALRGDPDAPGWQVIGHYAHEYGAGQMLPAPVPPGVLRANVCLQELLETAGQFAAALETVQGRQIAVRLAALGRQIDFLIREVHEVAEDLGATVAVLPPHRTPQPRARPRPAVDTTPPTPPRTPTPARRR